MTPQITIGNDKKIETICNLLFGGCSKSELLFLSHLVLYREGLSIPLLASNSDEMCAVMECNSANLRTVLSRMYKKGVIKKAGKSLMLHPAFVVLDSGRLLISFG